MENKTYKTAKLEINSGTFSIESNQVVFIPKNSENQILIKNIGDDCAVTDGTAIKLTQDEQQFMRAMWVAAHGRRYVGLIEIPNVWDFIDWSHSIPFEDRFEFSEPFQAGFDSFRWVAYRLTDEHKKRMAELTKARSYQF